MNLKQTPFVFLRALVLIEFFFAFLPFVVSLLVNLADLYTATPLAGVVSYNLLSAISLTTIQLFAIATAFALWYVPTYQIDAERIIFARHNLFHDQELAATQQITDTAVHHSALGKRMNYGRITLHTNSQPATAVMKNIPNPDAVNRHILALRQPAPDPDFTFDPTQPLIDLIAQGEGKYLEFKSSFLWDYQRGNANKQLHIPVLKNLTAYMNTHGGMVLVGVDDNGRILGLEPDWQQMKKPDADSWENTFNTAFSQMIGAEFRQYVDVHFQTIDNQTVAILVARPAASPVFLTVNGKEEFYIKTGNATQPLSIRQANSYIQTHFERS
jgi:hypothetical protein